MMTSVGFMNRKGTERMIRNIIFDIGNVLTDFRWEPFLKEKGFAGEMLERIAKASVLGPIWKELDRGAWTFEQVMAGFVRMDPEIEQQLHEAYDDMTDIVTIREYAVPWVEELKKKGYHVYYLSNFSRKIELECEKALIFREKMDGGILSYKDVLIKPDPAIYRLLLQRYDLIAGESVFLDDTLVNVEAAKALGMYGIHFCDISQAKAELSALGVI